MDRRTVRYVGALAAAAIAAIYYLIGIGVLKVVDPGATAGDAPDMIVFGGGAGTMFLVGAILLFGTDRRLLWIVGAILQVLVAAMYVAVAPSRSPQFEPWGITLRLIQVPLFAALLYLAWRAPRAAELHRPSLRLPGREWLRR